MLGSITFSTLYNEDLPRSAWKLLGQGLPRRAWKFEVAQKAPEKFAVVLGGHEYASLLFLKLFLKGLSLFCSLLEI